METNLAYLAGFFDGEGCIGIYKGKLKVIVAQVDPAPIERFQALFGGNIGIQKAQPPVGRRNLYRLQYHGERAKDVLANLYPYLLVKRAKAAEALES